MWLSLSHQCCASPTGPAESQFDASLTLFKMTSEDYFFSSYRELRFFSNSFGFSAVPYGSIQAGTVDMFPQSL